MGNYKESMNESSDLLKIAVMSYYRFRRGWICADETMDADVLVDSGTEIIEVEVKVSRYDLMVSEKKKPKHLYWKANPPAYRTRMPNSFLICVPSKLVPDALEFIEEVNPAYGLIEFDSSKYERLAERMERPPIEECVVIRRRAKGICKDYPKQLKDALCLRLTSSLIGKMKSKLFEREKVEK